MEREDINAGQSKMFGTQESGILEFSDIHYVNQKELSAETELFTQHILNARNGLGTVPIDTNGDILKWNKASLKILDTSDLFSHVNGELQNIENSPANYTQGQLAIIFATNLGVSLLRYQEIKNLIAISKKCSFEDKYALLAKLSEFCYTLPLTLRVGTVALIDFMEINRDTTDPTSYYHYLVEGNFDTNEARDKILKENQDYPNNLYPNHTKNAIVNMRNNLAAFAKFASIHPNLQVPMSKEITRLFKRLSENVQNIRTRSFQTIFDTESECFTNLRNLVQRYLESSDKYTRLLALNELGLNSKDRIIEASRLSHKRVREDKNKEFYNLLADFIDEYIEESGSIIGIITDDEVAAILKIDNDSIEAKKEPTFEEIANLVTRIQSVTSKKNFVIEPGEVEWHTLQPSRSIEVSFDANTQKKINVKLKYENNIEESIQIEYSIDTSKKTLDWNIPTDPAFTDDNPELKSFRKSLLIAAGSILSNIYNQAQEEHKAKQLSKPYVVTGGQTQPKRERVADPIYSLRKEVKTQVRELGANGSELNDASTQGKVKKSMVLPSKEEFEKLSKGILPADRELVGKLIEEFNQKGTVVDFQRKKGFRPDGAKIYVVNVECSLSKVARVLLRETELVDGIRNLEIEDIRYIKNIHSREK